MLPFMAVATQALELAEIELGAVTSMPLDVMANFGRPHEVDGEAPFTQGLACELATSNASPSSIVVGTTSSIPALTTALWMQRIDVTTTHGHQITQTTNPYNWFRLTEGR